MTIDRNDPRWTAYVLDEMDAAERTRFEAEFRTAPEAEEILSEIRETIGLVAQSLSAGEPAHLSSEQRQKVEFHVRPTVGAGSSKLAWAGGLAAAAVVLMGVVSFVTPSLLRSRSASVVVAPVTSIADNAPQQGITPPVEAPIAPPVYTANEPAGSPNDGQTVTTASREVAEVDPVATLGEVLRFAEIKKSEVDLVAEASVGSDAPAELRAASADESIRRRLAKVAPSGIVGGLAVANSFVSANAAPPPPPAPSMVTFDRRPGGGFNTEEYNRIVDNSFVAVSQDPLATLSIDVDTASYANVRRFLNQKTLPPPDAVRIEEMINYFTYDYAAPEDGRPVSVNAEVSAAPWNPQHRLVRLGIKGIEIPVDERAPSNLVFLVDVSGSMRDQNKLPLLKSGMKLLVEQLGENDRVAIVVYAGASGMVLPSTGGDKNGRILAALERLSAGGSTNGGAGIELAYDTAVTNFIEGGINRVILATDGDFNVGVTHNGALTRLIEEKARTGVFLSVLGFGLGNYNDAGLEALADKGNGNYAYIDTIKEARKVLVHEMGSTLVTIAKDVKIQVEFNPAEVNAYRLIGYENRVLEHQDFNDDTKDAGEIGSGHTVTALFEVVPTGVDMPLPGIDPLKYQTPAERSTRTESGELLTMKVRYKEPDGDESKLMEVPVVDRQNQLADAGTDYRFAASVAGFGMLLRDSPHKGNATYDSILELAESSVGLDKEGYRAEFIELIRRARAIGDLNRNE